MGIEQAAPLLVAAMPSEARHALEAGSSASRTRLGPWPVWSIELDGTPTNVVVSGIGMVNAGASLARILCEFTPSVVVNFGCAGAHRDDIRPGDVVIGSRYVHHRSVTILPDGFERYSGTPIDPEDSSCFVDGFDADPGLLQRATEAAEDWDLDPWELAAADIRSPRVLTGPVTSADTWTQSTHLIARIHSEHGTLCEDMEAAALAQISAMHQVRFLGIKDISNNEFLTATEHGDVGPSLSAVEHEVGRRAFGLTRRLLKQLAD